jgi:hypothetical protein
VNYTDNGYGSKAWSEFGIKDLKMSYAQAARDAERTNNRSFLYFNKQVGYWCYYFKDERVTHWQL